MKIKKVVYNTHFIFFTIPTELKQVIIKKKFKCVKMYTFFIHSIKKKSVLIFLSCEL